jgi:ankyrin repeat protein
MKELIDKQDYDAITRALSANPELANAGIPYDDSNPTLAHPLHRICDGVHDGKYSDEEAVQMARIFLAHGANVNGNELVLKKDSPLVAAASLFADKVAMLYIENGADINHPGCHGGTALHWAAWCGRPQLVQKLVDTGAEINKLCIDFKSTPLYWALHGLQSTGKRDEGQYADCVRILLYAGADKNIPNLNGTNALEIVHKDEIELKRLLTQL